MLDALHTTSRPSVLDAESRLRGYPSRFTDGKDLVVSNLELRSRCPRPPNVPPVSVFATFGQAVSLPGSTAM